MRIAQSDLQFTSQRMAAEHHETRETLRAWVGSPAPAAPAGAPPANVAAVVTLSPAARAAGADEAAGATTAPAGAVADEDDLAAAEPRLALVKLLVEALTGRPIRLLRLDPAAGEAAPPPAPANPPPAASPPAGVGWGVEYDYHASHREVEQTTVAASGVIRTADGREIGFDLHLSMSRQFAREETVQVRLGDARQRKDPLVLTFNGTAAQLTDTTFAFDLDGDGATERINQLGASSGYLALDRDGDGRVTNGRELFGPATGQGFAELAAHDADGNGWIDEGDPVFDQLRLWTQDAQGRNHLSTLAQHGVGAISLSNIASPFALKNQRNEALGQVRSTGVYLTERGAAGVVQQIDLVV